MVLSQDSATEKGPQDSLLSRVMGSATIAREIGSAKIARKMDSAMAFKRAPRKIDRRSQCESVLSSPRCQGKGGKEG